MEFIFASSLIFLITIILNHPDLFFRGRFLRKLESFRALRMGLGVLSIVLGLALLAYFVFNFITQLKWVMVLVVGFLMVLLGAGSASDYLGEKIKNQRVVNLLENLNNVYISLRKAFNTRYFVYGLSLIALLSLGVSCVVDF